MRKNLLATALLAVMAILSTTTMSAANDENSINSVKIDVKLDDNGDANITEIWDVTVVKGTEWFLVQSHLRDGMKPKDLIVTDETGVIFITEQDDWDIDRTLQEKAGRCGIVTKSSNHYELCWGFGSYGHHIFKVKYTMTNLVQALNDYDAFNHKFLSDGLTSDVKHVDLTISMSSPSKAFDTKTTHYWAFGTKKCKLSLIGGAFHCTSDSTLSKKESVIVMMQFKKGLFTPAIKQDRPFAEMKKAAIEGSDYEDNLLMIVLCVIFGGIVTLFGMVWGLKTLMRRSANKRVFGQPGKVDGWCKEVPFGGNLYATNYALYAANIDTQNTAIVGSIILKWIHDHIVSIEKQPDSDDSLLVFNHPENESIITDELEKTLFELMKSASGENLTLRKNDLRTYLESNKGYAKSQKLMKAMKVAGEDYLINAGLAKRKDKKHTQESLIFTEEGQKQACKMMQYKNYLIENTAVDIRDASDVDVLKDELMFAVLFNIAKKVSKSLKKFYPDTEAIDTDNNNMLYTMLMIGYHYHMWYNHGYEYSKAAHMSSGSSSSFSSGGGGGGFSGGGGGGCR